jgi:hypothetical protein
MDAGGPVGIRLAVGKAAIGEVGHLEIETNVGRLAIARAVFAMTRRAILREQNPTVWLRLFLRRSRHHKRQQERAGGKRQKC